MKQIFCLVIFALSLANSSFAARFVTEVVAISEVVNIEGDAAPDSNGKLLELRNPVVNNAGQAAFAASLINTTGGDADDSGTFRGDGTTFTQIAREGQSAPDVVVPN